ncbi:GtrA family protein [uncultured Sphingomonas sp.]|uniref:GtrA family protein n=1 Tax=uncultured Sphingomonas sp. TaxID=158754 RepID=UPI0035CC1A72
MTAILKQFRTWRTSPVLGQLVRFGIAGAISTAIYSAAYLPLALFVFGRRLSVLAVPPGFLVAAAAGFVLHSKWSFRGYGTRDPSGRQHAKFIAVQGFGMALNLAFTWIITGPLFHGPAWLPLVPAVLVTPIATFGLNRQLVFR